MISPIPHYAPKAEGIIITRAHPVYGGTFTVADDILEYGYQPGQQFVPHVIEDRTHPAFIGDIVTLSDYLARQLYTTTAFVSRYRTIKSSRRSNGCRQVELLGLPCRWFAIGHFKEYQGKQIYDHIWGDTFNRVAVDGSVLSSTKIILPNL